MEEVWSEPPRPIGPMPLSTESSTRFPSSFPFFLFLGGGEEEERYSAPKRASCRESLSLCPSPLIVQTVNFDEICLTLWTTSNRGSYKMGNLDTGSSEDQRPEAG